MRATIIRRTRATIIGRTRTSETFTRDNFKIAEISRDAIMYDGMAYPWLKV